MFGVGRFGSWTISLSPQLGDGVTCLFLLCANRFNTVSRLRVSFGIPEIRGFVEDYVDMMSAETVMLDMNLRAIAASDAAALRFGSICSGMGTAEMVLEILQEVWHDCYPDVGLKAG